MIFSSGIVNAYWKQDLGLQRVIVSDSCLGSCIVVAERTIVSRNPERCSNKVSTEFVVKDKLFVNSIKGLKLWRA